MMDRSKKLDRSETSDDSSEGIDVKTCVDCGTSRTPLWRSGPAGPKSLCNACGIKSRKKRRCSYSSSSSSVQGLGENRKKITRKRSITSTVEKLRRRKILMGEEEEQAAFLLMALSCGTVYAY